MSCVATSCVSENALGDISCRRHSQLSGPRWEDGWGLPVWDHGRKFDDNIMFNCTTHQQLSNSPPVWAVHYARNRLRPLNNVDLKYFDLCVWWENCGMAREEDGRPYGR